MIQTRRILTRRILIKNQNHRSLKRQKTLQLNNRQRLRVHLVLVLGFFLGGLMGALGFKYWGYITTVPLAALLWVLCLRPLLADLRWRAA